MALLHGHARRTHGGVLGYDALLKLPGPLVDVWAGNLELVKTVASFKRTFHELIRPK